MKQDTYFYLVNEIQETAKTIKSINFQIKCYEDDLILISSKIKKIYEKEGFTNVTKQKERINRLSKMYVDYNKSLDNLDYNLNTKQEKIKVLTKILKIEINSKSNRIYF